MKPLEWTLEISPRICEAKFTQASSNNRTPLPFAHPLPLIQSYIPDTRPCYTAQSPSTRPPSTNMSEGPATTGQKHWWHPCLLPTARGALYLINCVFLSGMSILSLGTSLESKSSEISILTRPDIAERFNWHHPQTKKVFRKGNESFARLIKYEAGTAILTGVFQDNGSISGNREW